MSTVNRIDPGVPFSLTLSSPASVEDETGVVLITAANLTPAAGALGSNDITNESGVAGATVTDALDALDGSITALILPTTSGAPVDSPADNTVRFDPATGTLYVKATAGWVSTILV
ncbi:MAG: hypothetical protein QM323_02805 [Acidobacteriota bacterium]|nr:hypothetical protein [Acidobacteriota bacterium]